MYKTVWRRETVLVAVAACILCCFGCSHTSDGGGEAADASAGPERLLDPTGPEHVESASVDAGVLLAPGWSTSTLAMHVARQNHVAALLQNGSVLVAGGHPGNNVSTATAEIYNPYGLTWTAVGSMSTPRRLFGACTLANGKVLVAGGNAGSGDVQTAELFDPSTNAWSTTGSLAAAREDFSMTCLANGRVLVAGGSGPSGLLNSAEIYDPTAATWSSAGTMPYAVHTQGAVQLPDGRVLVAGGNTALGPTNQAALWNATTNTWTATQSMATARAWQAVNLLSDGRVLAAGGLVNLVLATTNTAEIYDPKTGRWSPAASMHVARYSGVSATEAAGPIVIGGVNGGPTIASSESYDSVHNTWSLSANAYGAVNQTATALPSGDLLLAGGNTGTTATTNTEVHGICSNPAAQDGTPCDTGNQCTQNDACQGGVCLPGAPAPDCQAPGWSGASVLYKINDVVSYDGIVYRNLQVHTSTASLAPPTTRQFWTALMPLITTLKSPPQWFGSGALYEVGDQVAYNNLIYQAIHAHVSTTQLTPVNAPTLWQRYIPHVDGSLNAFCLPPTQMEPIEHCGVGLGCNWGTDTCQACGGDGQPCCDGSNTPFAGICYVNPRNNVGCPVCNTGSCDSATHTCRSCGMTAGSACCAADPSDAFAFCSGPGLVCNWSDPAMDAGTCAQCGGIDKPACAGGGCQSGLQELDDGLCHLVAPVINLASVQVTGPLTVQGTIPWQQCQIWFDQQDPGVPYPEMNCLTPTVGPGYPQSTPMDPSSAPRWMVGSGLNSTDPASGQVPLRLYTPAPSVTLYATVSFADDTSKLAENIVDLLGNPICKTSVLPGMVEGNHAHYKMTVQQWVDHAQNCQAPRQLDSDYPVVRFDGPSPDGFDGCWVDMVSNETDLYGPSSGNSGASVAPQDGTVSANLPLAVNLPSPSNYLRYVSDVWEGDTRTSSPVGWPGSAWSCPGGGDQVAGGCQDDYGVCPGLYHNGSYGEHVDVIHPTSSFSFAYTQAFTGFQLVVQPLAFAQAKVLPYSLVYAPPGNASKATYATSLSFGVNMAYDDKLANNMSNTVDNKSTVAFSIGSMQSASTGVTPPAGMGGAWGNIGIGETISTSSSFDQSTKLAVGTISDAASSQASVYQMIPSWTVSQPNSTPGANGTRATESFWGDRFILLVHPQIGLWQLGGVPVVTLLAARGTPASPDFFEPTVGDLNACATQIAPFATGLPIPATGDVLTSAECAQLLTLDPLFNVGQSFPTVATNNRFIHATGSNYGIDPVSSNDLNYSLTESLANTNTTTVQQVGSFTIAITNILTATESVAQSLSAFGITASENITSTDTTTTATDWTVTLQSSYTATAQSSVTVTGSLDDHHGQMGTTALPYQPYAEFYRDTVFGAFLFVDPTAP